jgi:Tol biopolymer transport system component
LAGADGNWPFWSPDGTSIGFFGLGKLHIISASGGTARTLADAVGSVGGDWSTSGVILYCSSGRFFSIPASGGTPKDLGLKGISGFPAAPRFLPDGRHFVFYEVRLGAGGVMRLASLDAETVTDLVPSELVGTFAPPDQLLFVRNTTLFAQRLDTRRFVLIGEPAAIASGVIRGVVDEGPSLSPSASANGTLAFQAPRGGNRGQLTWFDRDGKVQSVIESPSDNAEYLNPAISPDGAFVAATRIDPDNGTADIWQIDVARRVASKLTTDTGAENDVVWSHDGRYIAYRAVKAGKGGLYRQSLAGGAPELLLDASDALALPTDFSPDGRYLLFQRSDRFWRMWALPLAGDRVPVPLASDQSSSYGGHVSPDGKWLAYNSGETGQFEIVVRRFLSDGPTTQISNGGGVHPRWTRGGKEIVYWTPPRGIFANDISISGSEIRVGPTRTLVDRPVASLIDGRPHFDVTGDGQRLLVRQPAGPPGPGVRVIVNWMSKIAK